MSRITFNNPDEVEAIDTSIYRYLMVTSDAIVAADSATELVAALPGMAEGYLQQGNEEALLARYDFAVAAAREAQDKLAADTEAFDAEHTDEATLTALFGVDKSIPAAGLRVWNEAVPLVLIATDYVPFTDVPAPHGNITWINPADEWSMLETLAGLGAIDLSIAG